jgi:hypothetical protein
MLKLSMIVVVNINLETRNNANYRKVLFLPKYSVGFLSLNISWKMECALHLYINFCSETLLEIITKSIII